MPVLTDVHEPWQADIISKVVDFFAAARFPSTADLPCSGTSQYRQAD